MEKEPESCYEFGPFRLEARERRLFKTGNLVPIPPKVFDTLVVLVERRGRLVQKDEIMAAVWPSTVVGDISLARCISDLRKILEDGNGTRYIETVAKKGYRWVADVRLLPVDLGGAATTQERVWPWPRITLISAAVVVAAVIGWAVSRTHTEPVRSIAVLPMRPLDSSSHEESLELGLTDGLITGLSGSLDIPVRPTSSILKFAAGSFDPLAAGRELQVEGVLDSSLLKVGGRIRVGARLLLVRDGRALWAETFDESRDQLFRIQDEIVTRITPLLRRTPKTFKPVAFTPEPGYEEYLKGRYFWSLRNRSGVAKAVTYFQQAITANPSYSLAYAGLADAYVFEAGVSAASHEMIPLARQAAEEAIRLDPLLAEPHATLGLIAQNHELNWEQANSEYRKAIELNSRYVLARHWYAEFLGHLGRFRESAQEFEQAREIDPLSPAILNDMAKIDLFARDFNAASGHSSQALELNPQFYLAHVFLSYALARMGRCEQARKEHEEARKLEDSAYVASTLVWIEAACGDQQLAARLTAELVERTNRDWVSPLLIGLAYASFGDAAQAMSWLGKAIRDPDSDVLSLKLAPQVDPIRNDARFQQLLQRLKLQ